MLEDNASLDTLSNNNDGDIVDELMKDAQEVLGSELDVYATTNAGLPLPEGKSFESEEAMTMFVDYWSLVCGYTLRKRTSRLTDSASRYVYECCRAGTPSLPKPDRKQKAPSQMMGCPYRMSVSCTKSTLDKWTITKSFSDHTCSPEADLLRGLRSATPSHLKKKVKTPLMSAVHLSKHCKFRSLRSKLGQLLKRTKARLISQHINSLACNSHSAAASVLETLSAASTTADGEGICT